MCKIIVLRIKSLTCSWSKSKIALGLTWAAIFSLLGLTLSQAGDKAPVSLNDQASGAQVAGAGVSGVQTQAPVQNGSLGSSKPGATASSQKLIVAALGKRLSAEIKTRGFKPGAAAFIRIFKQSSKLEIWLQDEARAKRYRRFKTYEICKWSGKIGPKIYEGDLQSPEGFYAFSPWHLRPVSRNHRAIDIGFPNAFDIALKRSGSDIQIHGKCGSVGCFAMTDKGVDEIFRMIAAAFGGGQNEIMVHIFPFRMTDQAMNRHKAHRWAGFWSNLKPAYDAFEASHIPPKIEICGGNYRTRSFARSRVSKIAAANAASCIKLEAPTLSVAARRRALARAMKPKPRIKIRCNLKRPSCRKWLFLQKRILARKSAAKSRLRHRTANRQRQ